MAERGLRLAFFDEEADEPLATTLARELASYREELLSDPKTVLDAAEKILRDADAGNYPVLSMPPGSTELFVRRVSKELPEEFQAETLAEAYEEARRE